MSAPGAAAVPGPPRPGAVSYFTAPDGVELAYRLFAPPPEKPTRAVLLFVHGATYNGKKYIPIGNRLAPQGVASYLIDLRGHGDSGGPRGHLKRADQLDRDIDFFLDEIRKAHPDTPIFLGGHSAGTSLVLRYAEQGRSDDSLAGYVLVAPLLSSAYETHRPETLPGFLKNAPDFMPYMSPEYKRVLKERAKQKNAPSIYEFSFWRFLTARYLPFLRFLRVVKYNFPPQIAKMDNLVLEYSYSMSTALQVRDYHESFAAFDRPVLMVTGEKDESSLPEALETVLAWDAPLRLSRTYRCLPNKTHFGILVGVAPVIGEWIDGVLGAAAE